MTRRRFGRMMAALPIFVSMPRQATSEDKSKPGGLTDVAGVRVGHFTETRRPTGCTVIVVEKGAVAGVDVRGSAPGTRETDLLNPINTVQQVHAVVLAGGSAFGLDSASGVVQFLEEKGIGFDARVARVPIVPAAVLFDLGIGDPHIRPGREAGYQACLNATDGAIPEGNVGAGAGATVGKLLGPQRAMKGGLGTASIRSRKLVVAALVAVNAVGDVIDPQTGEILAGLREADGKTLANSIKQLREISSFSRSELLQSTTIGVIATNAAFDKAAMTKMAQMAHDGLARTINPVHLPTDGDTIFALSTGEISGEDLGRVGALAAAVMSEAVVRAIRKASGIPGYPSHSDLKKS
ncbi:MAG: P1 family peptidase [Acidobacteria bacterium]|nr:P1 family peptidase [Acidobacteriota bacterium]